MSDLFGDSVVPCDVLLEDVLWEDVLLIQRSERVFWWSRKLSEFLLSQTCDRMFFWLQTLERILEICKEYNTTDSKWHSHICLPFDSFLIFSDLPLSWLHRKKHIKEFLVVFYLLPTTFIDSCQLSIALWFLHNWFTASDSCLVFANWTGLLLLICVWCFGLDCWYPDNEDCYCLQRTTSKHVPIPLVLITIFLL